MAPSSKDSESEPASPAARLMQAPSFNLCILGVYGFATTIDVPAFKQGLRQTLLNHPRFSSLLVSNSNGSNLRWKPTTVDLESHVFCPDLDHNVESPDEFVEDYLSGMSRAAMDPSKPPWELHILNVKTSDANSTAIFKLHHSIGDGVSLVSLLLACATKTSDPESLPIMPVKKHKPGDEAGLITSFLFQDTETPIRARPPSTSEVATNRFVHRILDLNEIKLVKNAMNVSINDVMLGVTEAGLSRYLNVRYDQYKQISKGPEIAKKTTTSTFLPKDILLRSAVAVNLRPSATIEDLAEMMEKKKGLKGLWGNLIGLVLFSHSIALHADPLSYIHRAKATMDRKKLSLESKCSFLVMKLMLFLFGSNMAAALAKEILSSTTLTFSNVAGPPEEISLYGHPVAYIAPSVHGFPQALVIHYQSYGNKMIIAMCADEKLIPNPHQLCDDLAKSLQNIKDAVIKRGLVKDDFQL